MASNRPPFLAAWYVIGGIAIAAFAFWYVARDPELPASVPTPVPVPSTKGTATTAPSTPSASIQFAPRQDEASKSSTPQTAGTASALTIPENTPVKEVLQRLEAAAAIGNVQAACRVGVEKMRCLRAAQMTEARLTDDPKARADKELCRDVTFEQSRDAWKYLLQAAQGGNAAAASLYVRDPGLSYFQPTEAAEGWLTYRENAQRLLGQAVQGGDVMALWYSWWTSATGLGSGGEGVWQKNPQAALMYGNAVMPLLDDRRRRMVQNLNARLSKDVPPEQAAKAASEGAALRTKYFGASSPPRDSNDDAYLAPADCAR